MCFVSSLICTALNFAFRRSQLEGDDDLHASYSRQKKIRWWMGQPHHCDAKSYRYGQRHFIFSLFLGRNGWYFPLKPVWFYPRTWKVERHIFYVYQILKSRPFLRRKCDSHITKLLYAPKSIWKGWETFHKMQNIFLGISITPAKGHIPYIVNSKKNVALFQY